jgi:hypothetical protein
MRSASTVAATITPMAAVGAPRSNSANANAQLGVTMPSFPKAIMDPVRVSVKMSKTASATNNVQFTSPCWKCNSYIPTATAPSIAPNATMAM